MHTLKETERKGNRETSNRASELTIRNSVNEMQKFTPKEEYQRSGSPAKRTDTYGGA
jgi:hypothetical protein